MGLTGLASYGSPALVFLKSIICLDISQLILVTEVSILSPSDINYKSQMEEEHKNEQLGQQQGAIADEFSHEAMI